jgi:hypothetical protein
VARLAALLTLDIYTVIDSPVSGVSAFQKIITTFSSKCILLLLLLSFLQHCPWSLHRAKYGVNVSSVHNLRLCLITKANTISQVVAKAGPAQLLVFRVPSVPLASMPHRRIPVEYSNANTVTSTWYSQCIPGSGGGNPTTTRGTTPTTTTRGTTPTSGSGGSGLHNKFKAKGKLFFGTEIDHYHLNNNPLTTIVKNSFGQVTNENSMKWDAIERMLNSPR